MWRLFIKDFGRDWRRSRSVDTPAGRLASYADVETAIRYGMRPLDGSVVQFGGALGVSGPHVRMDVRSGDVDVLFGDSGEFGGDANVVDESVPGGVVARVAVEFMLESVCEAPRL
jgi:hypothetical protein